VIAQPSTTDPAEGGPTIDPSGESDQPSNGAISGASPPIEQTSNPTSPPIEQTSSPASPIVVAGQTVAPAQSGSGAGVVVGGSTLNPGQVTTIGGTQISVGGPGTIEAGGSTFNVDPGTSTDPAAGIATVGGQTLSAATGDIGGVVIGGQTLTPGQATVINNTPLSVGNGGTLVAGGATITLTSGQSQGTPIATFSVGGQQVTAQSGSPVVVGGSSLSAGGPAATISGDTISAGPAGVVVNGNTASFTATPVASLAEPSALFTAGGQTFTAQGGSADPNVATIDGTIVLTQSGSATVVDGQTLSLGNAGVVVDGTSVATLSNAVAEPSAIFTADGHTFTAVGDPSLSGTATIDGSILLTEGGSATVLHGETLSLGPTGIIVDGTSTAAFSFGSADASAILTVDGHTLTAVHGSATTNVVTIDGSITLTPGGTASVVDGETLSLGPNGIVVNGTTTVPFTTATSSSALPQDTSGAQDLRPGYLFVGWLAMLPLFLDL